MTIRKDFTIDGEPTVAEPQSVREPLNVLAQFNGSSPAIHNAMLAQRHTNLLSVLYIGSSALPQVEYKVVDLAKDPRVMRSLASCFKNDRTVYMPNRLLLT